MVRARAARALGTKGGHVLETAAPAHGRPVDSRTVDVLRATYRAL